MLESKFIKQEVHMIGDIPVIRLVPKDTEKPYKTIVFYHGWSSSKEVQLISKLGIKLPLAKGSQRGQAPLAS